MKVCSLLTCLQIKVLRRWCTASNPNAEAMNHALTGEDDLTHGVPPFKDSNLATPGVVKLRAGSLKQVGFLMGDFGRCFEIVEGLLGRPSAVVARLICL